VKGSGNSPLSDPAFEMKIFFAARIDGGTGPAGSEGAVCASAAQAAKSALKASKRKAAARFKG
jgi:hypothetical protein